MIRVMARINAGRVTELKGSKSDGSRLEKRNARADRYRKAKMVRKIADFHLAKRKLVTLMLT